MCFLTKFYVIQKSFVKINLFSISAKFVSHSFELQFYFGIFNYKNTICYESTQMIHCRQTVDTRTVVFQDGFDLRKNYSSFRKGQN